MKKILLSVLFVICTLQISYAQKNIATKISYFIDDTEIELNKNFKIYLYYEDGGYRVLYKVRPQGNRFIVPKMDVPENHIYLIFVYQKYVFFEYTPVSWLRNGHLKIYKSTHPEEKMPGEFFSDYIEGIVQTTYEPYDENGVELDGVASTKRISDFKQYFKVNKKNLKKVLKDW